MPGIERWLRVPGLLEEIPVACDFVVAASRQAGLDERTVHHCQLAVDEACTNIIEHGYGFVGEDRVIDIVCRQEADRFSITVIDDSPPFNPLSVDEPNPMAELEDRPGGGWGVYFIKQVMDEVTYQHTDGRNWLTMVKYLKEPAPVERQALEHPVSNIEVAPLSKTVLMVKLKGRLDAILAPSVEAVVSKQLDMGHRFVVADMSGVEYVSSVGLKTLVSIWKRVRELKGDIILVALTPRVREVFEMIGLDLVFDVYDSRDEAVVKLASLADH